MTPARIRCVRCGEVYHRSHRACPRCGLGTHETIAELDRSRFGRGDSALVNLLYIGLMAVLIWLTIAILTGAFPF